MADQKYWKILLVVLVITCENIGLITRGLRPLVINPIFSLVMTITTRNIFQYFLPAMYYYLNKSEVFIKKDSLDWLKGHFINRKKFMSKIFSKNVGEELFELFKKRIVWWLLANLRFLKFFLEKEIMHSMHATLFHTRATKIRKKTF